MKTHRRSLNRPALDPTTVVLVFDRDGEVDFYPSAADAARDMEAIDVHDGEYTAVFGLDGTVYSVDVAGEQHHEVPVVTASGERDAASLAERLEAAHLRSPLRVASPLPADFVNARALWEWHHRRPRWPRWLDRRLHGAGPALLPRSHS